MVKFNLKFGGYGCGGDVGVCIVLIWGREKENWKYGWILIILIGVEDLKEKDIKSVWFKGVFIFVGR